MAYALTGQQVVKGALLLLGVIGQGETPDSDQATDGLARLNELLDALGTQRLAAYTTARTTVTLTPNTGTYTIGTGGTINQVRPEDIDAAAYIAVGQDNEVPITLYSPEMYAALPIKTQTAELPYALYYTPSAPLGSLVVYPTPTSAVTLVLYVRTVLTAFADLSTSYTLPAGYAKMLRYQLAKEWAPEFGKTLDPILLQTAQDALADVKRKNITVHAIAIDSAIAGRGGYYDIFSDTP